MAKERLSGTVWEGCDAVSYTHLTLPTITEDLFDFTGNMPVIRDDATIAEDEWKLCPAELQCVTLETEHFIKGRTLRSFRTEKTIEHIQGNK